MREVKARDLKPGMVHLAPFREAVVKAVEVGLSHTTIFWENYPRVRCSNERPFLVSDPDERRTTTGVLAGWPKIVTNLRIFSEGGDGWSIDGYNDRTGEYSEQVLTYDTFAEAVSKLPDFVKYLMGDGVRIEWRPTKRHHHHWESWGSYGDMRCAVTNCTAVIFAHDRAEEAK